MEKTSFISLIIILFLSLALATCIYANQEGYRQESILSDSRQVVFRTLGACSPCLSSECTGVRNILEGIYGAMADIPGSYCYYQSCDVVGPPAVSQCPLYKMRTR